MTECSHMFSTLAVFGGLKRGLLVCQPGLQGGFVLLGRSECLLLSLQLLFEALTLFKHEPVNSSAHRLLRVRNARREIHLDQSPLYNEYGTQSAVDIVAT